MDENAGINHVELACTKDKDDSSRDKIRVSYSTKRLREGIEVFYSKNLPQEIWYTISDYILPTDILSFALICKQSYFVLNMPSFWIRLYKRYSDDRVPPRLKCHILERSLGLKASVVRSLFFTYPPFLKRKIQLDSYEKNVGMKCIGSFIHPKCSEESSEAFCWVYDFILEKFKIKKNKSKEKYEINYNPDIGRTILRVKADNYCIVNRIAGLYLKRVKYHRLTRSAHIEFQPDYLPTDPNADAVNVYIYTVDEPPGIFEWWHPSYCE